MAFSFASPSSLTSLTRSLRQRLHRWLTSSAKHSALAFEPLEPRLQLSAPVAVGDEFPVNVTTTGAQRDSVVSVAADGSFVVAWNSDGVYARRFDSAGNPLSSEFLVPDITSQFNPAISVNASGAFVVAWNGTRFDTDEFDSAVFAQVYDASGNALGSRIHVNTYTTRDQIMPTVALADDGSFVIAWRSDRQDGDSYGIYAQRFDSSAAAVGSEFLVNTTTTADQSAPSIAGFSDNGFVITWESNHQEDQFDIYGQRFDSSGNTVGSEFHVNTYTTGWQQGSTVAAARDDNSFVVTWISAVQDGSGDGIFAQRFDASGNPLGSEFQVNTYSTGNQTAPSIAMDAKGNFVIAWYGPDPLDASNAGALAQAYNYLGTPQGSNFLINTYTTSAQALTHAGMNSKGDLVATWASNGQDGSGLGLYAQRYTFDADNSPTTTGISDVNLYDTTSSSVTLPSFFSDDIDPVDSLTYTVESNSNTSLITNLTIDKSGVLTFDVASGTSESANITIRATDSDAGYVQDTFTINVIQHIDFTITPTTQLGDYPTNQSINLYDLYSVPHFARPFISFDAVKSYTGDNLYSDASVSNGGILNLNLTHTAGKGDFTLDASIFTVIPVSPSFKLTVVETPAPTISSVQNPSSPSDTAIDYVDFTFSQSMDVDSFDWTSVTLTYKDGANLINADTGVSFSFVSGTTYRVSGIAYEASQYTGDYVLTLVEGGVTNTIGKPLSGSAQASWSMDALPPAIVNISSWPVPRVIPVSSVAVRLSEPVDLATFTWEDLVLTRDGSANLTNSGITVAVSSWDPNVYQIFFPADLMSPSGNYQLTVNGEYLRTLAGGIRYTTSLVTNWTILAKLQNMSEFSAPRTTPLSAVAIRLSQPCDLSTFTWENIYLSVNGGLNIATPDITIAVSGWDPSVYQIFLPSSLVSAAGNYLITVSSNNLRTLSNNVGYGDPASTSWTMLGKVLNLSEFPTPRTTPLQYVSVRFSDAIDLSTFTWNDITLTRDGGANLSNAAITVALSTYDPKVYIITIPSALTTPPGTYQITVNGTTITTAAGVAMSNSNFTTWQMT